MEASGFVFEDCDCSCHLSPPVVQQNGENEACMCGVALWRCLGPVVLNFHKEKMREATKEEGCIISLFQWFND